MAQTTNNAPPGLHLLLIDDEAFVQEALVATLNAQGYKVTSANDGPEGLTYLARECPDAIIIDYIMPYWDGITTIRKIRTNSEYDRVPIILMASMLPPDIDPSNIADAFLQKPVQVERLTDVLNLLLSKRPNP